MTKTMSELNTDFFIRDLLSVKSGGTMTYDEHQDLGELRLHLLRVCAELESEGYTMNVVIHPKMTYTEEDHKEALEEDVEVQKDIEAFLNELQPKE